MKYKTQNEIMKYKTQSEIRQAFWNHHHFVRHHGWSQNDYPCDVRTAFVDFIDQLARNDEISDDQAQNTTL